MNYWLYRIIDNKSGYVIAIEGFFDTETEAETAAGTWIDENGGEGKYSFETGQHWSEIDKGKETDWTYCIEDADTGKVVTSDGFYNTKKEADEAAKKWLSGAFCIKTQKAAP